MIKNTHEKDKLIDTVEFKRFTAWQSVVVGVWAVERVLVIVGVFVV